MTRENLGTEVTEASSDQAGGKTKAIVSLPVETLNEIAAWRERLAKHDPNDPALIAGCQRLGRILGGAR